MDRIQIEICVDTPDGIAAALQGGADRIELCAGLGLGGLTPGPGLIEAAARASIPSHAMIRPRAGDFRADTADLRAMLADIRAVREAGLAGVVIGVAGADGRLDTDALARLVEASGPLHVTLHRVFDLTPDPLAALETAVELGIGRILTSGGKPTAPEGAEMIARLCEAAAGRIEIMAGSGVNAGNAAGLIAAGVDALHASCGTVEAADDPFQFGASRRTDSDRVAALGRAATQAAKLEAQDT